jgi:N-acetylglucosamine-6-phosphate deacetylase
VKRAQLEHFVRIWFFGLPITQSPDHPITRCKLFVMQVALTAGVCLTPQRYLQNPLLLIEDGVIASVGTQGGVELPRHARQFDFPGAVLAPGFIDLHIHGGAGCDIMDAGADAVAGLERHLARHGVTSYLPTTLSTPLDQTLAALDALAAAIERAEKPPAAELRARPAGIHLEGPFLSPERRGAHPLEYLQPISLELFGRFWEAARGRIKIMSVAPELPGACELITEATRRGVCVSLGHSNASYDEARAGIAAGARYATHTFNAMRPISHRDPGIIAAVLNNPTLFAEIIVDGIHVAPEMIELFLRAKGREGAVLVTDAISATGMGDGLYRLGSTAIQVSGGTCLSQEGKLAGSVLTLDRAVRNVMAFARWGLQDAVRLATINPAHVLGDMFHPGMLAQGMPADILVLSPAGEVLHTMIHGVSNLES